MEGEPLYVRALSFLPYPTTPTEFEFSNLFVNLTRPQNDHRRYVIYYYYYYFIAVAVIMPFWNYSPWQPKLPLNSQNAIILHVL